MRRAHVELIDQIHRALLDGVAPLEAPEPVGRGAHFFQEEIHGHGEAAHRALAQPVIGEVSQPRRAALAHGHARQLRSVKRDRALRGKLTGQHLGELLLAVAVDPCDAENFTRRHAEADAGKPRMAGPRRQFDVLHLDQRRPAAGLMSGAVLHGLGVAAALAEH